MSNFVFMSYGHFPARNESKLHSCHLKSEKNQQGTDESWFKKDFGSDQNLS
jgi:hypothetical protein